MNSLNKNTPTCALTDIMKHPLKSGAAAVAAPLLFM
jgi:hypothetical protein